MPPASRLGVMWREVEAAWLAPVSKPLDQRIDECAWAPDGPGAYCDRCGATIVEGERVRGGVRGVDETKSGGGAEFSCASCRDTPPAWDRFVRLGPYVGELAEWVKEAKFTRNHWLAHSLGVLLAEAVRASGVLAGGAALGGGVCVVPMPVSLRRRLSRGIDHAGAIASGLAERLDVRLERMLWREHRPTQRGLSPTAREENVAGSIHMRRGRSSAGKIVLVVDDVSTTGATLRAACSAVRDRKRRGSARSPRLIVACCVAVTQEASRRSDAGVGGT